MKDGDDEVFGVFISVSSLWRVSIILRANFMIFILCLKRGGVLLFVHLKNVISRVQLCLNLFVRDVCFLNSYVHINSYFVAFFR